MKSVSAKDLALNKLKVKPMTLLQEGQLHGYRHRNVLIIGSYTSKPAAFFHHQNIALCTITIAFGMLIEH